jgi:hypothetical protein
MTTSYGESDAWVPVCGSGAVLYYNDPITGTWREVCTSGDPIKYLDETTGTWIPLCCGGGGGGSWNPPG